MVLKRPLVKDRVLKDDLGGLTEVGRFFSNPSVTSPFVLWGVLSETKDFLLGWFLGDVRFLTLPKGLFAAKMQLYRFSECLP